MLLPGMMALNPLWDSVQQRHRQVEDIQITDPLNFGQGKQLNKQANDLTIIQIVYKFFICVIFSAGQSKMDPEIGVEADIFINNLCKMSVSRCKLCDN